MSNESQIRSITVTGDANIKVAPDEIILDLGVETLNKVLQTAKKQNDEIVQKVLDLSQSHNLDSKDIQTDYLSIEPTYRDYPQDKIEFLGYRVRKTITLTLKNIAKLEIILTEALERGITHVHGIEFRTTELKRLRNEARSLAIKAAQLKAEAMASELNQSIGEPLRIQEQPNIERAWNTSRWEFRSMGGRYLSQNAVIEKGDQSIESTIAPGQIGITARVTVEFALTQNRAG